MFHRCLSFHRHQTHCLSPNIFFSSATSFLSEKHHHTPALRNHKPEIRHRRLPHSHSGNPRSARSPAPVLGQANVSSQICPRFPICTTETGVQSHHPPLLTCCRILMVSAPSSFACSEPLLYTSTKRSLWNASLCCSPSGLCGCAFCLGGFAHVPKTPHLNILMTHLFRWYSSTLQYYMSPQTYVSLSLITVCHIHSFTCLSTPWDWNLWRARLLRFLDLHPQCLAPRQKAGRQ